MAFRHHYFKPCSFGVPAEPNVIVKKSSVDDSGNVVFEVSRVPMSVANASIPNPSDYTLEKLLNANIPLKRVDCSLDNELNSENVESFVEHNLKVENNEN